MCMRYLAGGDLINAGMFLSCLRRRPRFSFFPMELTARCFMVHPQRLRRKSDRGHQRRLRRSASRCALCCSSSRSTISREWRAKTSCSKPSRREHLPRSRPTLPSSTPTSPRCERFALAPYAPSRASCSLGAFADTSRLFVWTGGTVHQLCQRNGQHVSHADSLQHVGDADRGRTEEEAVRVHHLHGCVEISGTQLTCEIIGQPRSQRLAGSWHRNTPHSTCSPTSPQPTHS